MTYLLNNTSRTLRISLILIVLAAGFATHAYANTSEVSNATQPTIKTYQIEQANVATYEEFVKPGIDYHNFHLERISTKSPDGDLVSASSAFPVSYSNYKNDSSNKPTITKIEGEGNNYRITFRSTTRNLSGVSLPAGGSNVRAFLPQGLTLTGPISVVPLNDYTKNNFDIYESVIDEDGHDANVNDYWQYIDNREVHDFPGQEQNVLTEHAYATAIRGKRLQDTKVYSSFTNSNGQMVATGTPQPWKWTELKPTDVFDYRVTLTVKVAPTANPSFLSCDNSESVVSSNAWIENNRRGLLLTTAIGHDDDKTVRWYNGEPVYNAIPQKNERVNTSQAAYCADFSSVVAPVSATTTPAAPTSAPATNATVPQATAPATNATVPQATAPATNVTVPQYTGNDAVGNAGNGSNAGALSDTLNSTPASAPADAQTPIENPAVASQGNNSPSADVSEQTPVGESVNFVDEVIRGSGSYSPEVASGLQPTREANNGGSNLVDDVLAKENTTSGSTSRNIEYAIAGLLVLCALGALAANKKFGTPTMELASNPRVSLSPTGSLVTPVSLNDDERLYNSHIHLVDLPEQERELELVGASASSISGAGKRSRPVFDTTSQTRHALPSRIWNELVKRLSSEKVTR